MLSKTEANKMTTQEWQEQGHNIWTESNKRNIKIYDPRTGKMADYVKEVAIKDPLSGLETLEKETFVGIKKYSPR